MSAGSKAPLDLFVLQPGNAENDPNKTALDKTWGDNKKWIVINDVDDLVRLVKRSCGKAYYIRALRIGGHGNSGGFYLGRTWVDMASIKSQEGRLKEIIPYLRDGESVIYLDHCLVGQDEALMMKLSAIMGGIPVIGPLRSQYTNSGRPACEGPARICDPRSCLITHTPNVRPERLIHFLSFGQSMTVDPSLRQLRRVCE